MTSPSVRVKGRARQAACRVGEKRLSACGPLQSLVKCPRSQWRPTGGRKPPIVLLHDLGRVGIATNGKVRNLATHFDLANGSSRRSREVWSTEENSQDSQIAPVAELADEVDCPCCGALIFVIVTI